MAQGTHIPTQAPRIATIGCFDGVHLGHRALLEALRREAAGAGYSPLVVTFAEHPLCLIAPDRAPAILMPLDRRIEELQRLSGGSVLVLDFDERLRSLKADEFLALLRQKYGVEALVRGFNHHFGSDRFTAPADYAQAGAQAGVRIIEAPELRLPDGHAISSSAIRRCLDEGLVEQAAEMLGRPYSISGQVAAGRHIGRTIGFPTANVVPPHPRTQIPAGGVYAIDATTDDGKRFRGMLNIGVRPTLRNGDSSRSIEANLFDFDGDLYGRRLSVEFLKRIRSEQTFPSLEALRCRLALDREEALKL